MMPGLINLTGNSKKREQRISPRYGDQQVREVFIDFLSWRTSIWKKNGVRKVSQVGTVVLCPPGDASWKFLYFQNSKIFQN